MTYYVKIHGRRAYYRVMARFTTSNKGYRLLHIDSTEPISERAYYATPKEARFIRSDLRDPVHGYFHEIGNYNFFNRLEALNHVD